LIFQPFSPSATGMVTSSVTSTRLASVTGVYGELYDVLVRLLNGW
jgi:hypothetical protein